MESIYTICYGDANDVDKLGHWICSKGYEGVYNDSYRYNRMTINRAIKENLRHHRDFCYIGIDGYRLVIGKTKREMRKQHSMKFIEKIDRFKELIENN